MTSGTERLVDDLVKDLDPVQPLPRLRSAFAIVLAVWAAVLGVVLWSQQHTPGASQLMMGGVYFASFAGLLTAALGATLSALAGSRPGRDRLEILGLLATIAGLSMAALVCLTGILPLDMTASSPPGADRMCFRNGAFFSLLPAGVIFSFLGRGWAAHPIRAALIGLVAAGALGGVIVHLSCEFLGPAHLLMGHISVPFALTIVGLYPVGALLGHFRALAELS